MQVTLLPSRDPSLCAPLTSNRDFGDCLVANVPLRKILAVELHRAGFELVVPAKSGPKTIQLPIDHWIEVGALAMLARTEEPACLYDTDGHLVAWCGHRAPEDCVERFVTEAVSFPIRYPWDFLRLNEAAIELLDQSSIEGEVSPMAEIHGHLKLGPRSRILPGVVIEGNVVIGADTQIGPNAYIRGCTAIGDHCFVGNGAEVKNSVIYPNTCISRQCYVGDSVIGSHVTLGAGTATENHRHDGRNHFAKVKGQSVDTGRLKLGAIIGDGVKTGVNSSLEAAIRIGVGRTIKPGSYVDSDRL